MWQDEFVSALDNFKRDMIDLHAKRTCDMISDISKVLADSNTAVGISEAVSNPPSTEGAAEAVSKPSSIEGVAEATDFDGPSKEASGGSVPSSPAVDDYFFASRSDISNLDDACDAPSFRLFNESDPDFISTQDLAAEMLSLHVSNVPQSAMDGRIPSPSPQSPVSARTSSATPSPPAKTPSPAPPSPTAIKTSTSVVLSLATVRATSLATTSPPRATSSLPLVGVGSSGPSTHEKKNRKKRARKGDCDVEAKKLKTTSEINDVYKRCVVDSVPNRSRKADAKELATPFLRIGGFHVSLEYFREAMKPRGELNNEVMSCWIEMFNANCGEDSKMKSSIKNLFSPLA